MTAGDSAKLFMFSECRRGVQCGGGTYASKSYRLCGTGKSWTIKDFSAFTISGETVISCSPESSECFEVGRIV